MKIEVDTVRFGRIEVSQENIVLFPKGLIGFEHLKRYVLLDSQKGPSIQWLQAVDDPGIAFLVSDPKTFLPHFEVSPARTDCNQGHTARRALGPPKMLTLLHVDREKNLLHIHVQAPLLLDPVSRMGVQVVTDAETPSVSIPLKAT